MEMITDSRSRLMAEARLPKRRENGAALSRAMIAEANTPTTRMAIWWDENSQKKVLK